MTGPHTLPARFSLLIILLALVTAGGVLLAGSRDGFQTTDIFIATLTALLTSGMTGWAICRIRDALKLIGKDAVRFADGDLTIRFSAPPSRELGDLVESLNRMTRRISERIAEVNEQHQEHEAILSSMVEGVIAVNKDADIVHLNNAAATLLGSSTEKITGRSMYEVIRNHELQQLVESSLSSELTVEGEIVLQGEKPSSLQVHSTALRNTEGDSIGALIVLNDITRLRRLERMRRDFVANVSHELKTPLTSIRGFVETLLDGTLEEPAEARRFCKIIAKQVDRLQNIIEDLLSLSRIEQHVEQGTIPLKPGKLIEVFQSATQAVAHAAAEKKATINIECEPDFTARINAPLFEQVMVNLLDNALKYSDPGKTIRVSAHRFDTGLEVSVTDQGCGIDPSHLDRIFERFYRVDKARSRKEGGTGLGLAIVKHIVVAHGGHIRVESRPGEGSTFTVCLPGSQ
jgi:two-component system, OmpR family, phosphate regulon sensor histidine kinase PhoR